MDLYSEILVQNYCKTGKEFGRSINKNLTFQYIDGGNISILRMYV